MEEKGDESVVSTNIEESIIRPESNMATIPSIPIIKERETVSNPLRDEIHEIKPSIPDISLNSISLKDRLNEENRLNEGNGPAEGKFSPVEADKIETGIKSPYDILNEDQNNIIPELANFHVDEDGLAAVAPTLVDLTLDNHEENLDTNFE